MEAAFGFGAAAAAFAVLVCFLVHLYTSVWLKSERVRQKLRLQGIKGPRPSILYGNLAEMQRIQLNAVKMTTSSSRASDEIVAHDYTSSLFPYFEQWRKEYGHIFTYSTGMRQHMYMNKPELVKEMNQSITLDLGKPTFLTKTLAPMLGNGIVRSNGPVWAHQRKIVAPEFFMDKVKGMMGLMVESTQPMLRKWEESMVEGRADIRVDGDLREVSADVISRACFGSSYSKGKQIFSKLRSLQKTISKHSFLFGLTTSFASRFLATKKTKIGNLEKEIESLIWEAVKEREQECLQTSSSEKDLMQLILEGAMTDQNLDKDSSKQFIVDNCKNIYFAGHESTAVAASWCLMLLALHPEWQDQIRMELSQVCNGNLLDADSLPRLKTVTMVIQESLRLYPPAAFVAREALEETQLGNITIPKVEDCTVLDCLQV
ncbi:hypothetical protein Q3G72_027459 [Acer saccharum]|nr:hypothetical protein Q3G72_027459 [Acer saccharum]